VVEFYGDVDSCYIHHNWGENCDGSFEVGGKGEILSHNLIAYNIFVNNGFAGGFHVGGKFGVYFEDMRIENNIFYDSSSQDYAIGLWNGTPGSADIQYRNNILCIPNYKHICNQSGFIHQYNLYYLGGNTDPVFTLGTGDISGDPKFINPSGKDFHLQADSPAIDSGSTLDYTIDFDGYPVPDGKLPDMGAFEFRHKNSTEEGRKKP
jgi:hypothetical protein